MNRYLDEVLIRLSREKAAYWMRLTNCSLYQLVNKPLFIRSSHVLQAWCINMPHIRLTSYIFIACPISSGLLLIHGDPSDSFVHILH